jgi:proteasome assembly chaperone (PAC2) family protein
MFAKMAWQELEDGPALKANDAVLLNGLPKVGTVVGELVARYWSRNIVQWR